MSDVLEITMKDTLLLWAPVIASLSAAITAALTLGIYVLQDTSRRRKERLELWHQMTIHFQASNSFFDKYGIPGPGDADTYGKLRSLVSEYRDRNKAKKDYKLNLGNALYYQVNIAHLFFLNREYFTKKEMEVAENWFINEVCQWARLFREELGGTINHLRNGKDLFSEEFTNEWIRRGLG